MAEHTRYLSRGLDSSLSGTPIVDSKLRFTTDTGRLFLDNKDKRVEITDFVKGKKESEILALTSPLPKVYISSDTNKFWIFLDSKWVSLNESVKNASTASYSVEGSHAKNASTAEYSVEAAHAKNATNDYGGSRIDVKYAPLQSPLLTGTPTAPTADYYTADGNQITNVSYVTRAISEAIAEVTQFNTEVVTKLPVTGKPGYIYFVPTESDEEDNVCEEFIYVNGKFEMVGSTRIDLTGYYNESEVTGTGNAITGVTTSPTSNKITFTKGSTFLTQHPSVTKTSSTGTESPNVGDSIQVVDSVEVDSYGHLTKFRTKTVTFPTAATTATNASTANYATKSSNDSDGNNIKDTYVKKSNILSTIETITANTDENKIVAANVIKEMRNSFQDGVDTVYNGCKTYGSTPTASTPSAIVTAIKAIYDNRYSSAVTATKVGTATAAQVLSGYTFTNSSSVGANGSMSNNGAWTPTNINPGGSVTIPAGYHNGSGKVTANANQNSGTYTYASGSTGGTVDMGANNTYRYVNASNVYDKGIADADARANTSSTNYKTGYNAGVSATKVGTAGAAQVLSGYTFTNSSSVGANGSMTNRSNLDSTIGGCNSSYPSLALHEASYVQTTTTTGNKKSYLMMCPPQGYYPGSGSAYVGSLYADVASAIGLTANKMVSGNTVLGITGTDGGYSAGYSAGVNAEWTYVFGAGSSVTNDGYIKNKDGNVEKTFTNNYNAGYEQARADISSLIRTSVARYNSGVNSWGWIYSATDANNYVNVAYNQGVTNADNRANANSTNYKTGYNAGYSAGKAAATSNNRTITISADSGTCHISKAVIDKYPYCTSCQLSSNGHSVDRTGSINQYIQSGFNSNYRMDSGSGNPYEGASEYNVLSLDGNTLSIGFGHATDGGWSQANRNINNNGYSLTFASLAQSTDSVYKNSSGVWTQ